jgi:hypothetical protein
MPTPPTKKKYSTTVASINLRIANRMMSMKMRGPSSNPLLLITLKALPRAMELKMLAVSKAIGIYAEYSYKPMLSKYNGS